VLHYARRCWSGVPTWMSPVHPGMLTLYGRMSAGSWSRCSPLGILARHNLTPETALGMPPLRPWGPVCPSGIEAVDKVGQRDLRTPVGTEPQEEGGAWSPPAESSISWTTEDQRAVTALLGFQPAVMLVTPLRNPSPPQPPAAADAPAEDTLVAEPVESTVGTSRVSGADSSAEVATPPAFSFLRPRFSYRR